MKKPLSQQRAKEVFLKLQAAVLISRTASHQVHHEDGFAFIDLACLFEAGLAVNVDAAFLSV